MGPVRKGKTTNSTNRLPAQGYSAGERERTGNYDYCSPVGSRARQIEKANTKCGGQSIAVKRRTKDVFQPLSCKEGLDGPAQALKSQRRKETLNIEGGKKYRLDW